MIEDKIANVLLERFEEEDLKSCFLVDVQIDKANKVVVFVDSDDQLTIDMCRKVSRHLENQIESNGWMPEKYTLDVSSPGIDNPLRLKRQYFKNIGRKATVHKSDGEQQTGRITEVTEDQLTLAVDKDLTVIIDFNQIEKTFILVSFKS